MSIDLKHIEWNLKAGRYCSGDIGCADDVLIKLIAAHRAALLVVSAVRDCEPFLPSRECPQNKMALSLALANFDEVCKA